MALLSIIRQIIDWISSGWITVGAVTIFTLIGGAGYLVREWRYLAVDRNFFYDTFVSSALKSPFWPFVVAGLFGALIFWPFPWAQDFVLDAFGPHRLHMIGVFHISFSIVCILAAFLYPFYGAFVAIKIAIYFLSGRAHADYQEELRQYEEFQAKLGLPTYRKKD